MSSRGKIYRKLIMSKDWTDIRTAYLRQHPLCERCMEQGFVVSARCVHHRVPVETGRTESQQRDLCYRVSNLQALCYACHADIHKAMRSRTKAVVIERSQQRLDAWKERMLNKYNK